jgi:hypothetical protein
MHLARIFAATLLVSSIAAVALEPTAQAQTSKSPKSDDYGYNFPDDPLAAGGFGPSDARIIVRSGPIRSTLIRPRTNFVPELLKSVENL